MLHTGPSYISRERRMRLGQWQRPTSHLQASACARRILPARCKSRGLAVAVRMATETWTRPPKLRGHRLVSFSAFIFIFCSLFFFFGFGFGQNVQVQGMMLGQGKAPPCTCTARLAVVFSSNQRSSKRGVGGTFRVPRPWFARPVWLGDEPYAHGHVL